MPSHDENAASFDAAADVYARSRPGYPSDSVDWLLDGIDGPVVDLGAGTGLLTRAIADRVRSVIAVEPSDNMRAVLAGDLPGVTSLKGTGESMPIEDGVAETVVCAQAWHWVDVPRASAEVARVLRPGGRLGLVWNTRDESVDWVARFGVILDGDDSAGWSSEIRAGRPSVGPEFGPTERHTTSWVQRLTVDALVDLAASRSYVITMDDGTRARVLEEIRQLGIDVAREGYVALPYVTEAFRTTVVQAPI